MSHVDTYDFNVGILRFRVSKAKAIISRVKKRGNSFYILIPAEKAKELRVNDNDYVVAIIARILDVEPLIHKNKVVEGRKR